MVSEGRGVQLECGLGKVLEYAGTMGDREPAVAAGLVRRQWWGCSGDLVASGRGLLMAGKWVGRSCGSKAKRCASRRRWMKARKGSGKLQHKRARGLLRDRKPGLSLQSVRGRKWHSDLRRQWQRGRRCAELKRYRKAAKMVSVVRGRRGTRGQPFPSPLRPRRIQDICWRVGQRNWRNELPNCKRIRKIRASGLRSERWSARETCYGRLEDRRSVGLRLLCWMPMKNPSGRGPVGEGSVRVTASR